MPEHSPMSEFTTKYDGLVERVRGVSEPQKIIVFVSELPVGDNLVHLVESITTKYPSINEKYSKRFQLTTRWKDVDNLLAAIANDQDLKVSDKADFLGTLRVHSLNALANRIANSVDDNFTIGDSVAQPVTSSYLTNVEAARKYFEELGDIKKQLKIDAYELIYTNYEQYRNTPFSEIPEAERNVLRNRINAFTPAIKENSSSSELISHFNGEVLNEEQTILSKLQYLRIINEKVNFVISGNYESKVLASEQEDTSIREPMRVGFRTTERKNILTRRPSLLSNAHYGLKPIKPEVTEKKFNYIATDPEILDLIKQTKEASQSASEVAKIRDSLPKETQDRLDWLRANKEARISQQEGMEIAVNFLKRLGLASSETDAAQQIEDFKIKKTSAKDIKTIAVAILDTATNYSFESKNKLLVLPANKEGTIAFVEFETLLHELIHSLQDQRRMNSPIGLMRAMNGFGRSLILAEMGAMKMETVIKKLFDESSTYWSEYEFDMLGDYVNGKTFMQIVQRAFKPTYQNDEEITSMKPSNIDANKTKDEITEINNKHLSEKKVQTAKVVLRRVMRLYKDLGATADKEGTGVPKYPNSWSMAYELGSYSLYTQYPSTLTGIPSHRIDELKSLLPEISINGEVLNDDMILRVFVDSAYDVMQGKQK